MKRCSEDSEREGIRVRIRVAGRLDAEWSSWFEGLTVTALGSETWLKGVVADQAALHGLLSRIRDLGIPLLGLEVTDAAGSSPSDEASLQEPGSSVVEAPHPPRSGARPT